MTDTSEDPEQAELFDAVETDVRDVPLDAIEPTGDTTASLDNAISNLGTVSFPLLQLAEDEEYGYRIVDGRRRIAALRKQGAEEVTAHVVGPEFDTEADALTAVMNIVRKPNPVEEARAISRLIDNGYTPESLSRIGIPMQTVKKRMRLAKTPPAIRRGVRDGDIAEGTAEKVANLSPSLQQECATHYEEEGKLRRKDVKEIRQSDVKQQTEYMEDRLFDTPDVGQEQAAEGAEGVESGPMPEGEGEGKGDAHPAETGVEVPTDADAFQDYIQIAGAVRGYVVGEEYETAEEAVQDAVAAGTKLGLSPEETVSLLLTPPSHFLGNEGREEIEDLLS